MLSLSWLEIRIWEVHILDDCKHKRGDAVSCSGTSMKVFYHSHVEALWRSFLSNSNCVLGFLSRSFDLEHMIAIVGAMATRHFGGKWKVAHGPGTHGHFTSLHEPETGAHIHLFDYAFTEAASLLHGEKRMRPILDVRTGSHRPDFSIRAGCSQM